MDKEALKAEIGKVYGTHQSYVEICKIIDRHFSYANEISWGTVSKKDLFFGRPQHLNAADCIKEFGEESQAIRFAFDWIHKHYVENLTAPITK